jgi:hypothetical protein
VDPVPDLLLVRKSGRAGNRTRDLWICSQELLLTVTCRNRMTRKPTNEDMTGKVSVNSVHSASVQLENKITGRESQGAIRQDELIGGVTLTLTQTRSTGESSGNLIRVFRSDCWLPGCDTV